MNKKSTILLKHLKEIKQNPDDLIVTFNNIQKVKDDILYNLKSYLDRASNDELLDFVNDACQFDNIDNVYDVLDYLVDTKVGLDSFEDIQTNISAKV